MCPQLHTKYGNQNSINYILLISSFSRMVTDYKSTCNYERLYIRRHLGGVLCRPMPLRDILAKAVFRITCAFVKFPSLPLFLRSVRQTCPLPFRQVLPHTGLRQISSRRTESVQAPCGRPFLLQVLRLPHTV